jgi:hypothetical protein
MNAGSIFCTGPKWVLLAKKMKNLVTLLCLLAELKSLTRFFFCFALEPRLFCEMCKTVQRCKPYTGVEVSL